MYVDIHAHVFHPKIAEKAIGHLKNHYSIPNEGNGTLIDLLEKEKEAGIDRTVIFNAATKPEQVLPANKYMLEIKNKYPNVLEPFGALHPLDPNWEAALEFIKKAGFKGIKIHPDFQNFFLDDPKIFPILEEIGDSLLIICHLGDSTKPAKNPSCPYKMDFLVKKFPKVRFIAAHLGGYLHWEHVVKTLLGKPVYMETSSALSLMPKELRKTILQNHPEDFLLFGSDYPMFSPKKERDFLESCEDITFSLKTKILTNGSKIL